MSGMVLPASAGVVLPALLDALVASGLAAAVVAAVQAGGYGVRVGHRRLLHRAVAATIRPLVPAFVPASTSRRKRRTTVSAVPPRDLGNAGRCRDLG